MPRPEIKPVFDCSIHDFVTEDIDEFRNHLSTVDHTVSGSTKCLDCGSKCDNDPNEKVKCQPGQAHAKCHKCMADEETRVIERLRKEGRTHEVLEVGKKK